ncbi:MAG: HD domain-containing protein, partial [Magnetococcales bacterium]|nr:HD domain-containing protein [Magnetococcales bacterium]
TYNKKYVLFRSRQLPVDENVLLQLRENGVEKIYIEKGDYPKFLRLTARVAGYSGDNSQIRYLQEKFVFIDIHTLRKGSTPDFTVFTVESGLPTPIIAPDLPGVPTSVTEQHLLEFTSAYIFQVDLEKYYDYLQNSWAEEATYQPMNVAGGILMRENAKMAAHGLFHCPEPKEALPVANKAIDQILESMFDNGGTYYALLKISDQDFNTYIHSVNVAVLSMGLGIRLKLSQFQLQLLGLGGMLHDIGKTRIDPDLLLKKTKISPSEYESLREHVTLGVEWCREVPGLPPDVLPIVAQHHEQMDGTGYPDKLKIGQIDPLAQIVNIMEIYDSLTNRQPFRDAFSPFQSLGKMREMGKAINQEFLTQFILMLGEQHRPT